jgi:hypothetical protein
MAGEATAACIFSMRSVYEELKGPVASRLWRPGYCAVLIEKHVPVWVVSGVGYAAGDLPKQIVVDCNEEISGSLSMDLMPVMASLFNQDNWELRTQAEREGVLVQVGNRWWINSKRQTGLIREDIDESGEISDRYRDDSWVFPSGKIYEQSFELVAKTCRVLVIEFPGSSLGRSNSVLWMRTIGLDVDEFSLVVRG